MNEASEQHRFESIAAQGLRLGLVLVFFIFSMSKFSAAGAESIAPLVANSPFVSWLNTFGQEGAARIVGSIELIVAILLAVGLWRPHSRLALAGAAGATLTFVITLSFLLTTPGVVGPEGLPFLSGVPGTYVAKDFGLLGGSVVLLAQSLALYRSRRAHGGTSRSAAHAGSTMAAREPVPNP